MSIKILKEKEEKTGIFKIVHSEIEHTISSDKKVEYNRSKVEREDAVAVLIRNIDTQKFIFVRQYRYPVSGKTNPMMLEIVAGRIEKKDSPEETAKREVEEEIGYKLEKLTHLISYFTSPGYSSEKIHVFFANVEEKNKISSGGGLKEENEFLQIEEYDSNQVVEMMKNEKIQDGKTLMALNIFFNI